MKIAIIAAFEEPVPPIKYGGIELVVYNSVEEMVRQGHEVYLFASGDSKTSAHLIPITPQAARIMYADKVGMWRSHLRYMHINKIIHEVNALKPDIVFNHYGYELVQYNEYFNAPIYNVVHGPVTQSYEIDTYKQYKDKNYISISINQRKAVPDINWVSNIYNGVNSDIFEVGNISEREYFAFIGRISPEKGVAEVCQAIKKTNYKLKIAAKVDVDDLHYYETEVKPLIDGKQIEFLGEIDHNQKKELLKKAKGLLLWLNWEEPFGLVVIEAYAAGVPVIANARGSMPELIKNGQTGILVNSIDEMSKVLSETYKFESKAIRDYQIKNFTDKIMVDKYLALFNKSFSK